jgi:hypothetical protein
MLSDMHRVYGSGNDCDKDGNFVLWLDKSREDLAKIPGGPREGMTVTIYEVGEFELEATLEWVAPLGAWIARPVAGTFRDNHETWD